MNVVELLAEISKNLDALEAAVKSMDLTPQLVEINTRIQALAGDLQAKVSTP